MIVYHGAVQAVQEPMILRGEIGRDFGFGFYTTDIKEQAMRWARRKEIIVRRQRKTGTAILNSYEFDQERAIMELKIRTFPAPTIGWMEFIISCRSNLNFRHPYDMVIGNIADDNVGETISYVMQGVMRKEDAVRRLKFEKINNQICFNTERSLGYLRFIESMTIGGE